MLLFKLKNVFHFWQRLGLPESKPAVKRIEQFELMGTAVHFTANGAERVNHSVFDLRALLTKMDAM